MAVIFDNATKLAGAMSATQTYRSEYISATATGEYWRGLFNPGHNGTSLWIQTHISGEIHFVRQDTADDATFSMSIEMRSINATSTAWSNIFTMGAAFSSNSTAWYRSSSINPGSSSAPLYDISSLHYTRLSTASIACPIEVRLTAFASASTFQVFVPASAIEIRVVGEFAS